MRLEIPSAGLSADIPFWITKDSFLDEELDVSPVTIENVTLSEPVLRFTPATISDPDRYEKSDYWLVGSDTVETGINGLSSHTIQLVEPTKWLERFMVGSKAVTQPLRSDYLAHQLTVFPSVPQGSAGTIRNAILFDEYSYKTPISNKGSIYIYPPYCFNNVENNAENEVIIADFIQFKCTVRTLESGEVKTFEREYKSPNDWRSTEPIAQIPVEANCSYLVTYYIDIYLNPSVSSPFWAKYHGEYGLAAVSPNSAKERTLKDAALSMIYAAESLNEKEAPTFTLNEELATYLDTVKAPEITVTGATLREALDEVAKYVGSITRLDLIPKDGGFLYEINFEKYCKDEEADTSQLGDPVNVVTRTVNCEDYCTALDATADNVVNYGEGGTISDPTPQFFRTPRSEDASYRVTEGTAKIITAFPIERIDKLECRVYKDGTAYDFNLTPYLFESTEYGALSSYEAVYPFTKAYALCYTLGQKSITGLDFTVPNPFHTIFETPAIMNIINREIKANGWESTLGIFNNATNLLDFTKLLFRVTYVPTGTLRVRMRKPSSFGKPESVLTYNQSSAKLDARAFGRAMFGTALRMGNKVTTYVYAPPIGAKVPEKGTRMGEDGYISEVHVEYAPYYKKVTLEVSEGFNRLSQFVGVNKSQRIFEISERMSLDRHIVYEDLCLIGRKRRTGGGSLVTGPFLSYLKKPFEGAPERPQGPFILTQGFDDEGGPLAPCMLPALCYGAGNALTFTASFEDNYGAGRRVENYREKTDKNEYYAEEADVRYTDLFGRIDTMSFSVVDKMLEGASSFSESDVRDIANNLPRRFTNDKALFTSSMIDTGDRKLKIDKDSRECIRTLTYQISFLEADGVKVSPFLAESLPFAQKLSQIKIVPITQAINNLTEELPTFTGFGEAATNFDSSRGLFEISFTPSSIPNGCKGWAAVAIEGNSAKGRFLFGKMEKLEQGEAVNIYLTFFRKNNIKQEET